MKKQRGVMRRKAVSVYSGTGGSLDRAVELRVGVAKAVITPKKARQMAGGGIADIKKTYHDLYARALVLNDGQSRLVILTYDINAFERVTPLLRKRCQHELGIDVAHLIGVATHNHHCPNLRLDSNRNYAEWLAGKVFDLVKEAIAKEQPARVYFGCGNVYFARNRENEQRNIGIEPVDNEVQLLKVVSGGKTSALLFNYVSHPLMYGIHNSYGADYPGFATDEVEKKLSGAVALFGQGCGGNQGVKPRDIDDPIEVMKCCGHELAGEVLRIVAGAMQEVTGSILVKSEVLHLPFAAPVPYREALELLRDAPSDRSGNWIRALAKHYREGIPFLTGCSRVAEYPDQPGCNLEEVIVTKIGPLALIAMQGEVNASIGMRIKDALRPEVPVMVFAYMGEHNVYIPTRRLVETGDTYQARVVCTQYGSPVWWSPEVEDKMVEEVLRLMRQIRGET